MKYTKEFKIGLFVVATLVVSFFLINYLRGVDIFNKEIEVSARYDDVEGLTSSAPVFIKGYKAGKVLSVIYDTRNDDFVVTCSVLRDFLIPEDSRMVIHGVDIMGGKGVRIDLGTSDNMVRDGGFLRPASEPAMLDGIASEAGPLLAKATETLDSLTTVISSVNTLVKDGHLYASLEHLENTLASLRTVSDTFRSRSSEFGMFIDDLSALSSSLNSIAEKADTAMSGVSGIVASVDKDKISEVIDSFDRLLVHVNDPDGTLGRLLTDDSVYDSVDGLLNEINSLVQKIQENPKKYLRISVF